MRFGPTLVGLKFCIFAAIQVALVFTDFEERILPDEFTIGGTFAGLMLAAFIPMAPGLIALVGPDILEPSYHFRSGSRGWRCLHQRCSVGFGALYAKIRHREGLGFGDVKMVMMMGTFFGVQGTLLTLIAGSLLGSVVGLTYILVKRKDAATYELPFGSFLGVASIGVALYGGPVLAWYGRF